jgi:hypothetical protein
MSRKTLLLGLLAVVAVVGQLNAQTFSTDLFALKSNTGITPFQAQDSNPEAINARQQTATNPIVDGLLNTVGGLWSWSHKDIFGGALTAGLEVGGLAIILIGGIVYPMVAAGSMSENTTDGDLQTMATISTVAWFAGGVAFTSGMIFGFIRGMTQSKKQNSAVAGFDGNPLEHVSLSIVPGVGGSLMYSASF